MQQYSALDGKVGQWHLVHLGSRAVGGAGLIVAEATAVSPEGRSTTHDTGLWNDAQMLTWKPIVQFVHDQGAKIGIQLGHFGSKGSRKHPNEGFQPISTQKGGWATVSSSAVAPFKGMSIPEALSLEGIQRIQSQFVEAAKRAVQAGFDTIELHAAHGYLIHQFYSRLVNQRTDRYGSTFENRIRFLVEIVGMVRAVIPENMPLLVRLSAVDFLETDQAWKLEDSVQLSHILKATGADLITASAGGFGAVNKSKIYPGYQVPFAAKIKAQTGIATGAVGAITAASMANDIIEKNQADLVLMAREWLRNPYFGIHAAMELEETPDIPWPYARAFRGNT